MNEGVKHIFEMMMELRHSRMKNIAIFALFICTIVFITNKSQHAGGTGGFLLSSITRRKRVTFVGFRKHWQTARPYQCGCGMGLELQVDSSEGPKDPEDIRGADLVIFTIAAGHPDRAKWRHYHRVRHDGQKWMFATRESPVTCLGMELPEEYRFNSFHWSYTYSPDATFHSPYGHFIQASGALYSEGEKNWSQNKTRLMSWTSSHCPLPPRYDWSRKNFVLELRKHLQIDMYGKCGNLSCPKRSQECFHKLSSYKFALSLENSCCKHYISEKFWKALTEYHQVPVVFGADRENYEEVAPPNSFIFVEDFASMEELVDYIDLLDKNETLYNTYHEWRNHGWTESASLPEELIYHCSSLCRVARQLDNPEPEWNAFTFDPYGESWYGACRSCSKAIGHVFSEN